MNVINHVGRRSSYRYKERSRLCASILRELVDLIESIRRRRKGWARPLEAKRIQVWSRGNDVTDH